MRYKNYVSKITSTLEEYKAIIDKLESDYQAETAAVKAKAESMQGKWTDDYIRQYISEHNPDARYREQIQTAKAKTEPVVNHYLERIKSNLDNYFNAPIRTDFANKIMTVKMTGLELSDMELELLKQSASSYMECRLLGQLAEGRLTDLKLPNMEATYQAFNEYSMYAKGLVNNWSGDTAALLHLNDTNTEDFEAVSWDVYFKDNKADEFSKVMEQANAILPESKIKHELSDNDRKFIDTLIDSKYPSLAKERVKELAEADSHIESLLLLDERYSKYLEE